MGSSSKALQSSWVQRLRPREIDGTGADSLKSPCASVSVCPVEEEEEKEFEEQSSSLSRSVINPHLLPMVENVLYEPAKRLRASPSSSGDSGDLVSETHVIASFGPFQVRARSLVPAKEKKMKQQAEMSRATALVPADQKKMMQQAEMCRATAFVPADQWKQYSRGRGKEVATEQNLSATAWSRRLMIKPRSEEEDREEYRGGLFDSEIASTYLSHNKPMMIDYIKKRSNPYSNLTLGTDSDQLSSDKQKLSQFQWQWPEEKMGNNPGFCKEILPSSGKHVISDTHKMDKIGCERWPETPSPPFANAFQSVNATTGSRGFGQYVTTSDLPSHSTILKQMKVAENCSNHCVIDQQAIGKPETFQNVKANHLEPGSSRREHCHGLTPMLESHRYGFRQRFGRPNSMENYPFQSPNYPGLGQQKDELILPDNSSTSSFSSDVHADLLNQTDDRKKSSKPHFHLGSGTSFRDSDAAYHRPIRERGYLEEESNSSHHSNCPTLDQEYNSTEPENKDTGLSKQLNKANDDLSDVKRKGLNFENQLTEKRHVIGGDTGSAFQCMYYNNAIHPNYEDNYTVGLSRRSDLQDGFSSREGEEIGSGRDVDGKGCLTKGEKISTMVQCVLPGKESPRDGISFCGGKTIFDTDRFHQFKSRKQSAEKGPSFQRLHCISNDREAELDCNSHVRLKISAADRQTYSSGKRARSHEGLGPTDAGIANNIAAISEAITVTGCRPQMWLQRWIHSSERTDIVNEQVLGENWNSNLVKNHGSLTRNCTQEWSGDNKKADFVQWTRSRKENSSYLSGSRSQAFGEGHFKSEIKGSQFMKNFLSSSASAMAILETRTKEMYEAQPHRKDIFSLWASTRRADADAKVTRVEKEIKATDVLELNSKKMAFEKEIVEHEDIRV